MVLCSREVLEVGKIFCDLIITDFQGKEHKQPFCILREATLEEWIQEAIKNSGNIYRVVAESPQLTFYDVSLD